MFLPQARFNRFVFFINQVFFRHQTSPFRPRYTNKKYKRSSLLLTHSKRFQRKQKFYYKYSSLFEHLPFKMSFFRPKIHHFSSWRSRCFHRFSSIMTTVRIKKRLFAPRLFHSSKFLLLRSLTRVSLRQIGLKHSIIPFINFFFSNILNIENHKNNGGMKKPLNKRSKAIRFTSLAKTLVVMHLSLIISLKIKVFFSLDEKVFGGKKRLKAQRLHRKQIRIYNLRLMSKSKIVPSSSSSVSNASPLSFPKDSTQKTMKNENPFSYEDPFLPSLQENDWNMKKKVTKKTKKKKLAWTKKEFITRYLTLQPESASFMD